MKIKKGKMNIKIRLFNLAGAIGGVAMMSSSWNKRLKWNKKDKLGWFAMGVGGFSIAYALKGIMDDNFIPEKEEQETAPSMKEVSVNDVQ